MRIDSRAFGYAAGITAAVLYTLCAAFVAIAPRATTAFFGLVMHMDLSSVTRPLTWTAFICGLLFWAIGTGLTFAFAAWLYDRFATGAGTAVRAPLGTPAAVRG